MRSIELTFSAFLLLVVLVLGGCASGPFTMVPAPPKAPKPPFAYEPLNVHNSCFVESVNFYDHYYAQKRENTLPWARILEWGIQEGSFGIAAGHAVTVFVLNDQVWAYDVNFGFEPLGLAVARRGDITDVSPPIFSKYPKSHQVLARYRDDFPQVAQAKRPDFLFYHANPDIRDVTRVASELARFRPVSVVEFNYPENGQVTGSAATVFSFGARVCLYFPRKGTFISPGRFDVHDLRWITYVVQHIYPGAKDVRPQPGGYLFLPPKA